MGKKLVGPEHSSNKTAYTPSRLRHISSSSQHINDELLSDAEKLRKRGERFSKQSQEHKKNQEFGLISRGEDNRLQRDPEARREFFSKIQNDFTKAFAQEDVTSLRDSLSKLNDGNIVKNNQQKEKMDQILMSLRKLREALLKSEPDEFSKSIFLFSIRISTRIGHYQTYIPSVKFLLDNHSILESQELHDVAETYILHLCHFNKDDQLALEVQQKYCKGDPWLRQVLQSCRTKDFKTWFELYNAEKDVSKTRIMQFGEEQMISHAIKCLTQSYFQLPKLYLENLFKKDINRILDQNDCTWTLIENTVTIKSRK